MVPVTVSGTITNTGCTVTTPAYAVTDEYGQIQPSGAITLDSAGNYSFIVLLQASRLGTDLDGRQYTITVRARALEMSVRPRLARQRDSFSKAPFVWMGRLI